jgi:hypothetical protein
MAMTARRGPSPLVLSLSVPKCPSMADSPEDDALRSEYVNDAGFPRPTLRISLVLCGEKNAFAR